jgi:hypothetical protein
VFYAETTLLDDDAARQYRDAVTCFTAWEHAESRADSLSGGMVWKRVKGKDYLVRTSRKGKQTSLGPRSAKTEALFAAFFPAKAAASARLAALRQTMRRHRRMNRALRVGRVPNALIELLHTADVVAANEAFVIGEAALYAYEAAAGVRFNFSVLKPRCPPAPVECRVHLMLAINEAAAADGALALLRRADRTFEIVDKTMGTVMNSAGVAVDVLVVHQLDTSGADFWANPDRDIRWLINAPRWSEVIVGSNGTMARMTTVDPRTLVLHKDWLVGRGAADLYDVAVGEALERLVTRHLPQFDFQDLPG